MLFKKDVYPYEYTDEWEKFNETSFPEKEEFYTTLNMEEITYITYITDITNCMHVKRVFQDFEIKKLGKDHNLYLKCDILLSADVFEYFRKICLKFII